MCFNSRPSKKEDWMIESFSPLLGTSYVWYIIWMVPPKKKLWNAALQQVSGHFSTGQSQTTRTYEQKPFVLSSGLDWISFGDPGEGNITQWVLELTNFIYQTWWREPSRFVAFLLLLLVVLFCYEQMSQLFSSPGTSVSLEIRSALDACKVVDYWKIERVY